MINLSYTKLYYQYDQACPSLSISIEMLVVLVNQLGLADHAGQPAALYWSSSVIMTRKNKTKCNMHYACKCLSV